MGVYMKIIIEDDYNHKVEITSNSEIIDDVIDDLCSALFAIGFYPESVKNSILAKAKEYEDEEEIQDKDNAKVIKDT